MCSIVSAPRPARASRSYGRVAIAWWPLSSRASASCASGKNGRRKSPAHGAAATLVAHAVPQNGSVFALNRAGEPPWNTRLKSAWTMWIQTLRLNSVPMRNDGCLSHCAGSEEHVRHVRVRLTDVNGPRHGVDARCAVTAHLANGKELFVEATTAWPFRSVTQAAGRLSEAIRRISSCNRPFQSEGSSRHSSRRSRRDRLA